MAKVRVSYTARVMQESDKNKYRQVAKALLAAQNLPRAVAVGVFVTIIAALAYALAVAFLPFCQPFAAMGVGAIIGLAVGLSGHGVTTGFAVLAVALTLCGSVLGNLLTTVVMQARSAVDIPLAALSNASFADVLRWSFDGYVSVQLVFWFVAAIAAGFLARKSLSRTEQLALRLHVT
ncbi:MAG: hypothetical protein AAFO81_06255 [Pseudomonadota bacterium]